MRYPPGASVFLARLGKAGVVVDTGPGGGYRVRVGGVVVVCREEDLTDAPPPRRTRKTGSPSETSATRPSPATPAPQGALDLHGLTVDEALRAVEERLDAALRAGLDHLDIMHGRGTGRVKNAVHKYLRGIGAVRHFEITADNPGVTRAWL